MSDSPRGRPPFSPSGDRTGRGKGPGNSGGGNRREGGFQDRNGPPRFPRREGRPANQQSGPQRRPTVHYQVVMMDDEEWGDALENRLNSLGHDGWRLIAIDEGRQYVFMQGD